MIEKIIDGFDRGKVFYPHVIFYLATLHGIIDLAWRQEIKNKKGVKLDPPFGKGLELSSTLSNKYLHIDTDLLSMEFCENHDYLLGFALQASSHLLISAFDASRNLDKSDEVWNFLYHCRNASAHKGKFKFTNKGMNSKRDVSGNLVPAFPARWKNLEITCDLEGHSLFKSKDDIGILKPADPIYLLEDIEKTFSNLITDQPLLRIFGQKK